MPDGAMPRELPAYLRAEQERVERAARARGLDFFPVVFEMLPYDRMNEVAAFGGFPVRYPHWRFGMEYERLSRSNEYGLSKIYEMVINNNPSWAYLLEGNSLTDQRMVMCHVYGHVDFFKNNFAFRPTDLDVAEGVVPPERRPGAAYDPDRRWIDRLANHGAAVRRLVDRHGQVKVEELIDACLSLENLIDPYSRFVVRARPEPAGGEEAAVEVPRLRAKGYMEGFINPEDHLERERERLGRERDQARGRFPASPQQDVLRFLLDHAPLERWEAAVLGIIRDEAYYFVPQMQTKIMNEGWASYWHSRLMTEDVADWSDMLEYAENNAGVMATGGGRLNPYKLGVELFRDIEDRWNKGRFGRAWEQCEDAAARQGWDQGLGLGREKIFEVRAHYTDVTFIDEFLTEEFAIRQGLYTFQWSGRRDRFEIESREFRAVKEKLLGQLTNFGHPVIKVVNGNWQNRGELLLAHEHRGVDLRADYAAHALAALVRLWKRPVAIGTELEGKPVTLRFDGQEQSTIAGAP